MADSDWVSLADLLSSSGRPGPDQMVLVARWVTAALADGHRQGAVHGALSPRTVGLKLGADKTPVRATILPPDDGDVARDGYAAPEVVRGAAPEAASDVYSCGAVLWHCLTGQVPSPGSPPPVTAPEPLAGALRAMLAETPGQRASAARAAQLLAAPAAAQLPTPTADPTVASHHAAAPEPAGRAPKAAARGGSRGWVSAASVAILLLGLSALGWVVWQAVQQDPASTSAASTPAVPTPVDDESADDESMADPGGDGVAAAQDAAATTAGTTQPSSEDEASTPPPTQEGLSEDEDDEDDQPRPITLPTAAELCEDGLGGAYPQVWAGNEVTSCPFSVNVRAAYVEQGASGPDVEVVADSPVTGRTYTMTCEDTAPVRCRGGNAAIVYFGDD